MDRYTTVSHEDVHLEVARLICEWKWAKGELDKIGMKCGMGEREFRWLLALLRETVTAEGYVLI